MVYPTSIFSGSPVTEITQANMQETLDELKALQQVVGLNKFDAGSLWDLLKVRTGDAALANSNSAYDWVSKAAASNTSQKARVYPLQAFTPFNPNGYGYTETILGPYTTQNGSTTSIVLSEFFFSPPDDPLDNN